VNRINLLERYFSNTIRDGEKPKLIRDGDNRIRYDLGDRFNGTLVYEGEISKSGDMFDGKGILTFTYKSFDFHNIMEGRKEIYEGIFKHNVLDCSQTYKSIDFYGNTFEGTMNYGTEIYSDDYERIYCIKTWAQPTIPEKILNDGSMRRLVCSLKRKKYVGSWKGGNFNGKGTLTYKCGSTYIGYFKDNLRHGRGKMYYANGDSFQWGKFKDDQYYEDGQS